VGAAARGVIGKHPRKAVIPAQAGIHAFADSALVQPLWIPAYAGMTREQGDADAARCLRRPISRQA